MKDVCTAEVATVLNDNIMHLTKNLPDLLSIKLISQIVQGQRRVKKIVVK